MHPVGLYDNIIALYFQLVEEGVEPDFFSFPRVIKICAGNGLVPLGKNCIAIGFMMDFFSNGFGLNALVDIVDKMDSESVGSTLLESFILCLLYA
ncbi:hypothetical protein VIGAN_09005600 [Vigna angularis var. angularis]|uniref:Pentatricopeptide repeat-containing protein n=1 Tax=Vigna angularis var. angularis TaxID=157739 RepID=A0A0S3SVF5_PHAAN|nr:hypothetical protein VIGAN_09005600 [Vigna angularis var. angularis]